MTQQSLSSLVGCADEAMIGSALLVGMRGCSGGAASFREIFFRQSVRLHELTDNESAT